MATLASRINSLAAAIRDKINLMTPKLVPAGGTSGQLLAKSSSADHALAWVAPIIRLTGGLSGKPTTSFRQVLGKAPRAFTILAASCSGQADIAATASTVATLKKITTAGVTSTVGTWTWNAAGTLATVAISAGAIASGDMLVIDWPATADTTLANIAVLVGE